MSEFLPGEIGQDPEPNEPKPVALDALHRRLGGRMVAFAGFSLPLHYKPGIMAEHRHCREHAALFDVSHMGQVVVEGPAAAAAEALERLVPADLAGLASGRQVYTALLDEAGGILDDLIVARLGDRLFLVVNAARRSPDLAHLTERLPERLRPRLLEDQALLALQGPGAAAVMQGLAPETAALPFMSIAEMSLGGITARVSRSGYTGEDGFEISVAADQAEALATRLLGEPGVLPAGLGARDSLRLEAGLPLYGQDIDELTTPVEAGLSWIIARRRRTVWDFPGAAAIRDHLENGPPRHRVGLRPDGRAPARAQTPVVAADGTAAGTVTSGGFGPSVETPIAMGYVRRDLAAPGTKLFLTVRGRDLPATVTPLPFVAHRYARRR